MKFVKCGSRWLNLNNLDVLERQKMPDKSESLFLYFRGSMHQVVEQDEIEMILKLLEQMKDG